MNTIKMCTNKCAFMLTCHDLSDLSMKITRICQRIFTMNSSQLGYKQDVIHVKE